MRLFTSESVSEGHPDKVADYISDSILDAYLEQDAFARVACECLVASKMVVVSGEISAQGRVDVKAIVIKAMEELGYSGDYEIIIDINTQSPDIAMGVNRRGAGDQGMMFGYACTDTVEMMPAPIMFAHKILKRLSKERKYGSMTMLMPDAKSQITVSYDDKGNVRDITDIVVSHQHTKSVPMPVLRNLITNIIVDELGVYMTGDTRILINPTGRFVVGGPEGDTGLTGRKIIVDTYGGMGRHGGGAFSGKDATKVDRTGAYMARHIAVSLVGNFLCTRCEVQLSYAIGIEKPISINVDTFGTGILTDSDLVHLIRHNFDLRPYEMIEYLGLRKPIFTQLTNYGHFGKHGYPWEQVRGLDYVTQ